MNTNTLSTTQTIILSAVALLPAVLLLIYINRKDRVEKEPVSLIIRLVIAGALVSVPVAIAELFINNNILLGGIFYDSWYQDASGTVLWDDSSFYIYALLENFLGVALIEELGKWLMMRLRTEKNPNFNCLFDGVVYAVSVSLGFAALENVLYVISNAIEGGVSAGMSVAVMRAVLSVPSHMFFGILMGYHYSYAHAYNRAHDLENYYAQTGALMIRGLPFSDKRSMRLSLIIPTLVHGLYDFLLTIDLFIPAVILVVFLYIFCFGRVRKLSDKDIENDRLAFSMLLNKYPELRQTIYTQNNPY